MNGLERQNELSLRTFVKSRPVAETSAEDDSGKENTMRNPPGTEMRFPHIRRFTILELLIVIGIIAILAGMLLPALNSARRKAKDMSCVSNMKQIGIALNGYADDWASYTPLAEDGGNSPTPYYKWQDKLANYITADFRVRWNGDYVRLAVFRCPSQIPEAQRLVAKNYGMNGYLRQTAKAFFLRVKRPSERMMVSDIDRTGNTPVIYEKDGISADLVTQRHLDGLGVNLIYGDLHVASLRMSRIPASASFQYFWGQNIND